MKISKLSTANSSFYLQQKNVQNNNNSPSFKALPKDFIEVCEELAVLPIPHSLRGEKLDLFIKLLNKITNNSQRYFYYRVMGEGKNSEIAENFILCTRKGAKEELKNVVNIAKNENEYKQYNMETLNDDGIDSFIKSNSKLKADVQKRCALQKQEEMNKLGEKWITPNNISIKDLKKYSSDYGLYDNSHMIFEIKPKYRDQFLPDMFAKNINDQNTSYIVLKMPKEMKNNRKAVSELAGKNFLARLLEKVSSEKGYPPTEKPLTIYKVPNANLPLIPKELLKENIEGNRIPFVVLPGRINK